MTTWWTLTRIEVICRSEPFASFSFGLPGTIWAFAGLTVSSYRSVLSLWTIDVLVSCLDSSFISLYSNPDVTTTTLGYADLTDGYFRKTNHRFQQQACAMTRQCVRFPNFTYEPQCKYVCSSYVMPAALCVFSTQPIQKLWLSISQCIRYNITICRISMQYRWCQCIVMLAKVAYRTLW